MGRAFITILLLLAFLLSGAASASAHVDLQPENRVGGFGVNPNESIWEDEPPTLGNTGGNHFALYDLATGVVFYVVQNPWTKFDPLGLEELSPEQKLQAVVAIERIAKTRAGKTKVGGRIVVNSHRRQLSDVEKL